MNVFVQVIASIIDDSRCWMSDFAFCTAPSIGGVSCNFYQQSRDISTFSAFYSRLKTHCWSTVYQCPSGLFHAFDSILLILTIVRYKCRIDLLTEVLRSAPNCVVKRVKSKDV